MGRKTDQRRQLRRRDFISRRALAQLWAPALPACLAGRVVDCEALDIRASLPQRRRTVATDQPREHSTTIKNYQFLSKRQPA